MTTFDKMAACLYPAPISSPTWMWLATSMPAYQAGSVQRKRHRPDAFVPATYFIQP